MQKTPGRFQIINLENYYIKSNSKARDEISRAIRQFEFNLQEVPFVDVFGVCDSGLNGLDVIDKLVNNYDSSLKIRESGTSDVISNIPSTPRGRNPRLGPNGTVLASPRERAQMTASPGTPLDPSWMRAQMTASPGTPLDPSWMRAQMGTSGVSAPNKESLKPK